MIESHYRINAEPLPRATPVPWRCRWFGHTFGTLIPAPPFDVRPIRLIQKCGRRGCQKWTRVVMSHYIGNETEWLELHEVLED
jgi:hypothetical protein